MTAERVIASGRDAELIDLGDGRLLRRPRVPRSLEAEASVMRLVRAAGFPVPEVFEMRPDGMVLERIPGPTMLDDMASHPWRVGRHARTLARLHHQLHAIRASEGLPAPFGEARPDDVLVHGDFHPANVLLSPSGPVVIDWSSAGRGPAGADVADAWLVLAAGEPPGSALIGLAVAILRSRFVHTFLREVGREQAVPHLEAVAHLRVGDDHMTRREAAIMLRVAARHGRP